MIRICMTWRRCCSKGETTDTVYSYFGLRTVEWHDRKFYLNGKPLFQRLVLDQGFYPDGIYTAPATRRSCRISSWPKSLGSTELVCMKKYLKNGIFTTRTDWDI